MGGIQSVKSLLFSPYPAFPPYVVRTPHPGITDDRENITEQGTLANVCNCFGSNDDTLKVLNMKKSLSTCIKFLKAYKPSIRDCKENSSGGPGAPGRKLPYGF